MKKKERPDWYNALTLLITAYLLFPLLVTIVTTPIFATMLGAENTTALLLVNISNVIATYIGSIYASRFLTKRNVIENPDKIIYIVLAILVFHMVVRIGFAHSGDTLSTLFKNILPFSFASAALFYLGTKKNLLRNVQ